MHRTTPRFWRHFEQLPEPVQRIARRNFRLLIANPKHPALHFKKVGEFWSVRMGLAHRALAVKMAETSSGFRLAVTTNMID